ncbi:MAG: hypothetical protein WC117_01240 [Sphaerochaetaceae bacterium]
MRKIYTRVVIDIATGNIDEEESYLYEGPVAECKGGGGSTDAVDEAYNARMATIYEAQEGMAEEYYDYWKDIYKPYETAQVAANRSLIPAQTEQAAAEAAAATAVAPSNAALNLATNEASLGLLPYQTDLAKTKMADTTQAISEYAPIRSEYTSQALNGVDIGDRMTQAKADVASAFANQTSATNRDMSRMGINPNSGRYADQSRLNATNQAKATASAATTARTTAEDENYTRLKDATNLGLSYSN